MQVAGFIVLDEDNNPVAMDLSDNIAAGLTIDDPWPIFSNVGDAEECALNNAMLFGDSAKMKIAPVVLVINIGNAKNIALTADWTNKHC